MGIVGFMDTLISHFDPEKEPWLKDEAPKRLMAILQKGGGEARIVGGAVRDALLGKTTSEIDFAVNLEPQKVTALLVGAGIKVVPTGIDHGTVTAVLDHKGYELTTLREDQETDGRHAKVVFTNDWHRDAARRDFTFNALYVAADGTIYDYFEGRKDLASKYVRFIGNPEERIKEDVLRILRFFRFYAWFGEGAPDDAALKACRNLAPLIPQLSAERKWREITKLLLAKNPVGSWELMLKNQVLQELLPEAENLTKLTAFIVLEGKYKCGPEALARLAALLPKNPSLADVLSKRFKLSNREAEALFLLTKLSADIKENLDPLTFRRILYECGPLIGKGVLLLWASENKKTDLELFLKTLASWENPTFPLRGEDLQKLGMQPGPKMGEALKTLERWWIEKDFKPTRDNCLAEAKQHLVT